MAEGGAPILRVSHDGEGDWQFLCNGDHGEGSGEWPVLWHFAHVLQRDQSLVNLDVCVGDEVVRRKPGARWKVVEDFAARTRRHIAVYGWSVVHVAAEASQRVFAYTIGLWETLAHPELILIGLPRETAHKVLNDCGTRIQKGERLRPGLIDSEVLERYPVMYVEMKPSHAPTWIGYAIHHYGRRGLPGFLQIVWPDREGRFPWDPAAPEDFKRAQPLLGPAPSAQ